MVSVCMAWGKVAKFSSFPLTPKSLCETVRNNCSCAVLLLTVYFYMPVSHRIQLLNRVLEGGFGSNTEQQVEFLKYCPGSWLLFVISAGNKGQ